MAPDTGWRGDAERALARELVGSIRGSARALLRWRGIDLAPAAEHALYTALRRPDVPAGDDSVIRGVGRIVRAAARSVRTGTRPPRGRHPLVLILVTQAVHVELARPVIARLRARGLEVLVVDAETHSRRAVRHPEVDRRLVGELRLRDVATVLAREVAGRASVRQIAAAWPVDVPAERRGHLVGVFTRGVGLAALDAARIDHLAVSSGADVIACFNESGMLSRVAPAVGRHRGIPVVDLPHAEANDPFGTAGVDYDAMLVYGPRARSALEAGGVAPERIVEVGPLRYDDLIARGAVPPESHPRRVVFASQPSDASTAALHPDIQREAFESALAAATALAPSEVVVVPHPTERPQTTAGARRARAAELDVPMRLAEPGSLHASLRGAWLLVTASSQSVFEAVLTGVPAVTVTPAGLADPVTFARDGIAVGIGSAGEATALGADLADAGRRNALAAAQLAALGDRLGPLDGRAAERVADVLADIAGIDREANPQGEHR